MLNKLKQLGINVGIQYINGTGDHHYYDQVNNIIVIDLNEQLDDLMESIVNEYIINYAYYKYKGDSDKAIDMH